MSRAGVPDRDRTAGTDALHLITTRVADAPTEASAPVLSERRPVIRLVPTVALILVLWWAQVVLIPLVLSVLVSYALEPFVTRLESLHIPRPAAVPLLLVTLIGLMSVGVYSLRGEAVLFIEQLPIAARTVRQALQQDQHAQTGSVAKVQQAAQELESAARDAAGREIPSPEGEGLVSTKVD